LRIAITADPLIPVPPENYGGIERIIDFLATELTNRGHEVLLAAHPASSVHVPLLPYKNLGVNLAGHLSNVATIAKIRRFKPNIIHSFSRLAYLIPFFRSGVPKIMSYQREPTISQVKRAVKLAKKGSLSFTGCSDYISDKVKPYASCRTVYNGVDMQKYRLSPEVDIGAPLVFLGRIEPNKGTRTAVNVAIASQRRIIIAGNIPNEYKSYFDGEIKPMLNEDIEYFGPINDSQKNELLGRCAALLMPIAWNEPFGIVMAEAMACGTPVIGFNKGSVPEIIVNGINGFKCDTQDEMIQLVQEVKKLNRRDVRREAEERFSSSKIVDEYMKVYCDLLSN
jgi:glycosyltransferase involved in cell wall biosynthesis